LIHLLRLGSSVGPVCLIILCLLRLLPLDLPRVRAQLVGSIGHCMFLITAADCLQAILSNSSLHLRHLLLLAQRDLR